LSIRGNFSVCSEERTLTDGLPELRLITRAKEKNDPDSPSAAGRRSFDPASGQGKIIRSIL